MATEIHLTDREADVMRVLWERGPSVVNEVKESLADDLAYTTVLTILRTLEQKGYVKHEEEGRVHRYAAAVKETAARKSAHRWNARCNRRWQNAASPCTTSPRCSAARQTRCMASKPWHAGTTPPGAWCRLHSSSPLQKRRA